MDASPCPGPAGLGHVAYMAMASFKRGNRLRA